MKPDNVNLQFELKSHARKGGKTSRRRQTSRVQQFIRFCHGLGVREPGQIGKKQVWLWYQEGNLSPTTLRDRYYAICLLWEKLGRGEPPRPHIDKAIANNIDIAPLG